MITVDQLFAEDFKPAWLREKERLVKESLEQAVTTEVDFAFREYAAATRERIAARCDPRGNYANTPKTPATATGVRRWRTLRKQSKRNLWPSSHTMPSTAPL